MTMYANNARTCKNANCFNIFEPSSSHQEYCEECLSGGSNKNINSNINYQKKQKLHKELVELYNSMDNSKLNSLNKNILKEIKEYASYTKASIIKNKTTIKLIQKYINCLLSLK